MGRSSPFCLGGLYRSTCWPSGVFPQGFFAVVPDFPAAPLAVSVLISMAPVIVIHKISFIRIPRCFIERNGADLLPHTLFCLLDDFRHYVAILFKRIVHHGDRRNLFLPEVERL